MYLYRAQGLINTLFGASCHTLVIGRFAMTPVQVYCLNQRGYVFTRVCLRCDSDVV